MLISGNFVFQLAAPMSASCFQSRFDFCCDAVATSGKKELFYDWMPICTF